MATVKLSVTLRAWHPHDAALLASLDAVLPRRRAAHLRELALAGLTAGGAAPTPNWLADDEHGEATRRAVLCYDTEAEHALHARLAAVQSPRRRAELLRQLLTVGLLGAAPPAARSAACPFASASTATVPAAAVSVTTPASAQPAPSQLPAVPVSVPVDSVPVATKTNGSASALAGFANLLT